MFTEPEFGGDSAVGQAIGYEGHHLLFPRCQQGSPNRVDHPQGRHVRQSIEHVIHLAIVDPNLAPGNAMDTFAEHRERSVGKKKNALRARAQGIHHQFAVLILGK